jgi:hypothetical protein
MTEQELAIIEKYKTTLVEYLNINEDQYTDTVWVPSGCTTCGDESFHALNYHELVDQIDRFTKLFKGD